MFLFRHKGEEWNARVGIEPRHLHTSSTTHYQPPWMTRQYFTLDDFQHHDSSTTMPAKKHIRRVGTASTSGLFSRLLKPFHRFRGLAFKKLHDQEEDDGFVTRTRSRRKRQGRRRPRVHPLLHKSDDNHSMNAELTRECNMQVYNMALLCAGDDEPPVHIANSPREYGMCPLGHQELVYFKL